MRACRGGGDLGLARAATAKVNTQLHRNYTCAHRSADTHLLYVSVTNVTAADERADSPNPVAFVAWVASPNLMSTPSNRN